MKAQLPIWNINGIAEFFLQIVGGYRADYRQACQRITQERDRLYESLRTIPFLRVIPSQANYFLCEAVERYTASELTETLLDRACDLSQGLHRKNRL